MKRKRIDIITLGCSKNLVDTERLSCRLAAAGYDVVNDSDDVHGDIAIVNTCGFIGDAKQESIDTILELAEAKKQGRIKQIFVMGCLSQRYFEDLKGELPEVDRFYGKFDWDGIINDLGAKVPESVEPYHRRITTPRHYTYLKISEGCNRFCAFCAIPLITGRHKSVPIEVLENEVRSLTAQGVKEFNVIAQDLSSYGTDIYGEPRLAELVDRLAGVEGVEWLRLHYAYPAQFPWDVLPVMARHDNVCRYLDIALQHISDNVLANMRRHITKAETMELIERIRREVPGIHLRTTLMVGFPGEAEAEFEELKEFVEWARFDRMGAFAYSEEDGTYAAAHYADSVPQEVKESRLAAIMELQESIALELNEQKVGKTMKVLIDREEPDYYVGRTEFDSPEVDPEVLVAKKEGITIGEFADVTITEALPFELIGEINK